MTIHTTQKIIRIGVTGHRKIDNPDTVAEQIRQVLNERIYELFDKNHMHQHESNTTAPFQFCVVTSLAEGADRIVAKEVLKNEKSIIKVVLPLSKEDYLNDFLDDDSKREFEELLNQDPAPKVLQIGNFNEKIPSYDKNKLKEERKRAYLKAGEYIVDHCDFLIAIWDEKVSRGKGGTGDIVAYARRKSCPLIIIPTDRNSDQ